MVVQEARRPNSRNVAIGDTVDSMDEPGPVPWPEHQALVKKLQRSDELIRQLKHMVKAQHGKIEELRERLDAALTGVHVSISEREQGMVERMKHDNEQFRRMVNVLKADAAKIKSDNDTLRKANRRFKNMLHHTGDVSARDPMEGDGGLQKLLPQGSATSQFAIISPDDDHHQLTTHQDVDFGEVTPRSPKADVDRGPDGEESPFFGGGSPRSRSVQRPGTTSLLPPSTARTGKATPSLPDVMHASTPRTWTRAQTASGTSAVPAPLPTFTRLSRLLSALPNFWKDLESPCAVLRALSDVVARLLSDVAGLNHTVYALDPWLRAAADSEQEGMPIVFYLGQGTTQLQVVRSKDVKARPEAPCFSGMQALPLLTRTHVAITLQIRERQLAVLQVSCSNKPATVSPTPTAVQAPAVAAPKVLRKTLKHEDPVQGQEFTGFTDSVFGYLQLICGVAAGLLTQTDSIMERHRSVERMQACMDVAVEVNKARSLQDFEQRVKHLFGTFFNVGSVRLLFFDAEQKCLLSSANVRKKEPTVFGLDKGIVGLTARKLQIMNVASISQSPYVDNAADGLQRAGKPVSANASMLCGPLLGDPERAGAPQELLGVVQLLERRRPTPNARSEPGGTSGGGAPSGEFTAEEQNLFSRLLPVCAYSAWRIWKVQELTGLLEGTPTTLSRLLSGNKAPIAT